LGHILLAFNASLNLLLLPVQSANDLYGQCPPLGQSLAISFTRHCGFLQMFHLRSLPLYGYITMRRNKNHKITHYYNTTKHHLSC
jgi:hypothetical protein